MNLNFKHTAREVGRGIDEVLQILLIVPGAAFGWFIKDTQEALAAGSWQRAAISATVAAVTGAAFLRGSYLRLRQFRHSTGPTA